MLKAQLIVRVFDVLAICTNGRLVSALVYEGILLDCDRCVWSFKRDVEDEEKHDLVEEHQKHPRLSASLLWILLEVMLAIESVQYSRHRSPIFAIHSPIKTHVEKGETQD